MVSDIVKTALVLGASGETGKEVVRHLMSNELFSKVILIVRKIIDEPSYSNCPKIEQRVIDFDKIKDEKIRVNFKDVNCAFCCLGTTRGKSGKYGFYKVDHDYVVSAAEVLHEFGCSEFHLLTSKGSDPNSWFLYPRTKGETENDVRSIKFNTLVIYRPGLLLCDRLESRPLEWFARKMIGNLDGLGRISIRTSDLASVMVSNVGYDRGETVMEHANIVERVKNMK